MFIIKISKLSKILLSCLFLALLLITQISFIKYVKASTPSKSHSANAMWIEPSTEDLSDEFNVTVWLNITETSFTWQIKLFYNSSYFNATRIGYTNGTKSTFFSEHSPMPVTPIVNNEEGYILHGETLLGNDERVLGYGSLFWIEFKLLEIPPQNHFTLNFSSPYGVDTFVLNPFLEVIPMETVVGLDITMMGPPPLLLYLFLLIVIVIVVATAVFIVVLYRRRSVKKNE